MAGEDDYERKYMTEGEVLYRHRAMLEAELDAELDAERVGAERRAIQAAKAIAPKRS